MIIDETIASYMEWLDRISKSPRIHIQGLEKCTKYLNDYLDDLINKNEVSKITSAIYTLNEYSKVILYFKNHDSFFISEKMQKILQSKTNLEKLLNIPEEKIDAVLNLSEANWTMKKPISGMIRILPANFNLDEVLTLRNGFLGTIIYVITGKATVIQLNRWPESNCFIISTEGGPTSEELNFAKHSRMQYINGASEYLKDLVDYDGKFINLIP